MTQPSKGTSVAISAHMEFALLTSMMTLVAVYTILRYGGLWGEADTFARTGDVLSVLKAGHIVPAEGSVYPNGYGFQSLATFLVDVAGVSVADLQLYGSALLGIWVVIPAWLAYREFTGTTRGATLATIFLLVQPEFLFVILRGTHEKFTRGLMLLCLYLLIKSMHSKARRFRFAGFVLAFYIAGYSIIALNNLLANSFIVGIGLSLLLSYVILLVRVPQAKLARATTRRLGMVVLSLIVMFFVVTFYIYPPAEHDLLFLKKTFNKTAVMVLDVEQKTTNPYAAVQTGWISLPVYFAVSLANWVLLGSSAVIWGQQSVRWLFRRWQPQAQHEIILWVFYGAFALQTGLSLVVDASGAVEGTLQHRIFPSFVMLAAPVSAAWLAQWKPRKVWLARLVNVGLAFGIGILSILSIFKATNEPLLSNKWIFYIPGEIQALDWTNGVLPQRFVWTENDERIKAAYEIRKEYAPLNIQIDQFEPEEGTRDFMMSAVTRVRTMRMHAPSPLEADSFITYDNGQAQVYHLRPHTPYQR